MPIIILKINGNEVKHSDTRTDTNIKITTKQEIDKFANAMIVNIV